MEILGWNAKPLVLDTSKHAADLGGEWVIEFTVNGEKHAFAAEQISIDTFYFRRKVAGGDATGPLVNADRRETFER